MLLKVLVPGFSQYKYAVILFILQLWPATHISVLYKNLGNQGSVIYDNWLRWIRHPVRFAILPVYAPRIGSLVVGWPPTNPLLLYIFACYFASSRMFIFPAIFFELLDAKRIKLWERLHFCFMSKVIRLPWWILALLCIQSNLGQSTKPLLMLGSGPLMCENSSKLA